MEFTKFHTLSIKDHLELDEKWVQARIAEDPSILGLGDVILGHWGHVFNFDGDIGVMSRLTTYSPVYGGARPPRQPSLLSAPSIYPLRPLR